MTIMFRTTLPLTAVLITFLTWAPAPSAQNQYCAITKDHTLCKFQGIGPRCKTPLEIGIPTSDRNLIMSLHNSFRKLVATGAEPRGRPGPQPMASNMRQLEWDDELAASAQRLADQCKYNHDCLMCRKVDRFLTGQNLYQFSENLIRDGANWEQAIKAWYNEVADFNPRSVDYFEFKKELGHYTQILWADTYRMGCGYAYYNDGKWNRKLYICNYGPAGNIITTQMYKRGTPCTECPEGTFCSQQYPGLCAGGSGKSYFSSAPAAPALPPPHRVTYAPTTRATYAPTTRTTTTTTTTTTRRPTTTTTRRTTTTTTPRTTTTTVPPQIIFNEIESNEILPVESIQPFSVANRNNFPNNRIFHSNSQSNRQVFSTNQIPTTRRYYETTTPRRTTTSRPYFNRFTAATTRRSITRPISFSPQIFSIDNRKPVKPFQKQTTAVTTYRPQIINNRIPQSNSGSNNFPQAQNFVDNNIRPTFNAPSRFISSSTQSGLAAEIDVKRINNSPAHAVQDSNTILLFCDFDFAKCPIRFTGESWNYTVLDTPGYGKGFSTVVERSRNTNLYIRSIMHPSGDGNICLHFRFVNYHFSADGSHARGSGLGPDGKPLRIMVTVGTLRQKPTVAEFTQLSQSPTDWLTARVQFRNIQSMFLLIFQVPNNVLQDLVYMAIDDILVTQGLCHT